jgi:hypothetical protein
MHPRIADAEADRRAELETFTALYVAGIAAGIGIEYADLARYAKSAGALCRSCPEIKMNSQRKR